MSEVVKGPGERQRSRSLEDTIAPPRQHSHPQCETKISVGEIMSAAPPTLRPKRKASQDLSDDGFGEFSGQPESNKRQHLPPGLNPDDDEDESNDNRGDSMAAEIDESFFDLLQTFAGLDLPTEPEKCPLCPESFPVADFAKHVYECIKQLDDVEAKHQFEKDEQLAYQIALSTTNDLGTQDIDQYKAQPKGTPCPDGANCRRYDASHHAWFKHPDATCPICSQNCPVYEIDAHVVLCLEAGPQGLFGSSSSSSSSSSTSSSSSSNSSVFVPRDTTFRDGESDDELEQPVLSKQLSTESGVSGTRDNEGEADVSGLSMGQMGAMSRLVLEQRAKSASNQDVSLVELLGTFKTLGFTKENLSKALTDPESKRN
mmetsp:Transcript_20719/g.29157  ORF Transcript_20719/g.29157 Transcript_20719/m.29157 type:complete len:372 (-) Transcript_20719:134-1249(-)